ncbi:MAG: hypothetical protein AB7K71_35555, partial [Polyangiaceae bacterium]
AGLALSLSLGLVACGSGDETKGSGGDGAPGGSGATGGWAQGGTAGAAQGGSAGAAQGGSSGSSQGGTSGGGNGGVGGSSFGGSSGSSAGGAGGTTGGTSAGGTSAGGAAAGGTSAGGSSAGGGSSGGTTSAGGTSAGGSSAGGTTSSGGSSAGGSSAGGSSAGGSSAGGAGTGGAATGGSGGLATGGTSAGGAGGTGSGCTQDSDCDDATFCNGAETCDTNTGACLAGQQVTCSNSDNATCTTEVCSEAAQGCVSVPQDALCSNGLFCDGAERCDPANSSNATGCVAGTAPSCNDGFSCTTDSCSEGAGCVHTPVDSVCSNGEYCDGAEKCAPGTAGADAQGCVPGPPIACNDNIGCTTDRCDEGTDSCKAVANDTFCDDGVYCNGAETCATNGAGDVNGCLVASPVVCNDNVGCTDDVCDENLAACKFTPNQGKCGAGQACLATGCVAGTACTQDSECDDGDACTVGESCNLSTGLCVPGTAKDCSDGLYCTVDSCEPGTGACFHTPQDIRCGNSTVCDGVETCAPNDPSADSDGCLAGAAPTCNDGFSCTTDYCDAITGCQASPNDSACSDGAVCNGLERCSPGTSGANAAGCVGGTTLTCPDDGVSCTTQMCAEAVGGCVAIPDDDLCTGTQTCDPIQGCGNYCVVRACQGKVYECGDCLDNDSDGKIDSKDVSCLGACDNNEDGYKGEIPGQNAAPCKSDCYFDGDSGAGNDDCYWSHECDTHEIAPKYDPEGKKCEYDPGASLPGTSMSCAQAYQTQSNACLGYCGPLTPNGCDCFGCCAIPGAATTVYLGSEDNKGDGTCTPDTLNDPSKCRPCDQVPACLNTCEHCEICLGKPELPADCIEQQCPVGRQQCGRPGQAECPANEFCVTGCCYPTAN